MDHRSKLRTLYIAKLLYDRTDEEHYLSTSEILSILKDEYGIEGYRTTVASDIEVLVSFGMEIESVRSSATQYHLISREFDLPEIKLLIDAVESSKFITEKKSRELVTKLGKLASRTQADELKRNLVSEGRIKPDNEYIYYIVDAVNRAINLKKKIAFRYFGYNVHKQQEPRHNGEVYVFSPYHLVWNGDYYYMIGYSDKHGGIGSFRVDRISRQPTILPDEAAAVPDGFDLSEYINTNFRMYNSEHSPVELICELSVMDAIIDRFGEEVQTFENDETSFRAVVNVAVNHVFFSWVFGFGGKVRIVGPEKVRTQYADMIASAYDRVCR